MNVNGDHDVIHRTTCRLWSFALLECSDTDRSLHPSVREDCSSSTTQGNEKRLSTSQHIHVYIGFLSWKSMQSGLSGATRARAPAVGGHTTSKSVVKRAQPVYIQPVSGATKLIYVLKKFWEFDHLPLDVHHPNMHIHCGGHQVCVILANYISHATIDYKETYSKMRVEQLNTCTSPCQIYQNVRA